MNSSIARNGNLLILSIDFYFSTWCSKFACVVRAWSSNEFSEANTGEAKPNEHVAHLKGMKFKWSVPQICSNSSVELAKGRTFFHQHSSKLQYHSEIIEEFPAAWWFLASGGHTVLGSNKLTGSGGRYNTPCGGIFMEVGWWWIIWLACCWANIVDAQFGFWDTVWF